MDKNYIPNSSYNVNKNQQSINLLQQTKSQVDEIVGIMQGNVERVLDYDKKLIELDNRADFLRQGACQFEQRAVRLKRKMWWKSFKLILIIGVIIICVFLILIYWIVDTYHNIIVSKKNLTSMTNHLR